MRYLGMMENDIADSDSGVSVSFWVQGCPFHCPDCHNKDGWDFNGGKPLPADYVEQVIKSIRKNGIAGNLSILGGEPLCEQNLPIVLNLASQVRASYPDIKIYVWTGYTMEQLDARAKKESELKEFLLLVDILVDGLFDQSKKDTRLRLRGSTNQNIYERKGKKFVKTT